MAIALGNDLLTGLYLGTTQVVRAYKGGSLVFGEAPVEEPGGDWTPSSPGTLAAWWDASDNATISLNGETVSALADKTGNGHTLTAPDVPSQPTLGSINSVQALSLDGTKILTRAPSSLIRNQAALTTYTVLNVPNYTTRQYIFKFNTKAITGAPGWMALEVNAAIGGLNNNLSLGGRRVATDAWMGVVPPSVPAGAVPHIFGGVANYSGQVATMNVDGGPVNTKTGFQGGGNTEDADSAGLALGGQHNAATFRMAGQIGEVLLYQSALSGIDRAKVEGYLAHKWGLTGSLPADHPYKTTAP